MSGDDSTRAQQARTLRDAATYFLDHCGKTVIARMPGSLVGSDHYAAWCNDITLLVEVVGMRFAIAFDDGKTTQGPLDPEQLEKFREDINKISRALEDGLASANSQRRGVKTITCSPLDAHRAGSIDGVDQQLRGVTKKISAADAKALLDSGKIVLLPPLGSGAGEKLALDADQVAIAFASASQADKLVVIATDDAQQELGFEQETLNHARALLAKANTMSDAKNHLLEMGCAALEAGVDRVHYLAQSDPAGMLLEFLLPDGITPMLSRDPFEAVRKAQPSDEAAIMELIEPGMKSGALRGRTIEEIRECIDDFAVVTRDEAIIACASLSTSGETAEFGCLAVRPDYSNQSYGQLLLDYFSAEASKSGVRTLLAVTSRAMDWFVERGFSLVDADKLPEKRKNEVTAKGSDVLAKKLS